MQAFTRLTQASVEALRYRGEDIARSITKSVVKEVGVLCSCLFWSRSVVHCDMFLLLCCHKLLQCNIQMPTRSSQDW